MEQVFIHEFNRFKGQMPLLLMIIGLKTECTSSENDEFMYPFCFCFGFTSHSAPSTSVKGGSVEFKVPSP